MSKRTKRFMVGHTKRLSLPEEERNVLSVDSILKKVEEEVKLAEEMKWHKTVVADKWEGKNPRPKLFMGVISSNDLDRHKEVMIPRGGRFKDFLDNPVVMNKHDHGEDDIGNIVALGISKTYIYDLFYFHGLTKKSREQQLLYEAEEQRAFSIGFVPTMKGIKFIDIDKPPKEVELDLWGGEKETINIDGYDEIPRALHFDWILLEKSCCVVGSNPAALMIGEFRDAASEIRTKIIDAVPFEKRVYALGSFDKEVAEIERVVQEFEEKYSKDVEVIVKAAVPPHSVPLDSDNEWDATKAKASLAIYATENGSGKKEDIDLTKYIMGFGWVNTEKVSNLNSYLFCHHYAKDGNLVTSEKALWEFLYKILSEARKDYLEKPYPNEHACRLKDPGKFDKWGNMTRKHSGKEYRVIRGKLKGEDTWQDQSFRYKKDVWSVGLAKSHCGDSKGSFEAASGKDTRSGMILDLVEVYEHAKKHFSDIGITIPKYAYDYSAEDLALIRRGEYKVSDEPEQAGKDIGLTQEYWDKILEKLNAICELKETVVVVEENIVEKLAENTLDLGAIKIILDVISNNVSLLSQAKVIGDTEDQDNEIPDKIEGEDVTKALEGLKELDCLVEKPK